MEGGRRRTKIEIGCMLRIVMCFILFYFFNLFFHGFGLRKRGEVKERERERDYKNKNKHHVNN